MHKSCWTSLWNSYKDLKVSYTLSSSFFLDLLVMKPPMETEFVETIQLLVRDIKKNKRWKFYFDF